MRGIEQIPWFYDLISAIAERLGADVWRDRVVSDARGLTLEVGAGTGRNLSRYPKHARVIALEPDRMVARAACRRTRRVPMVIGSAEALPFRESVFDAAVSCLVFCSVPDPLRGLHEVRRVLKPKATLHMLEHVRSTGRVGAWLQDLIQPVWTVVAGGCHPNRDTEANVEAAGFVIDGSTRRRRGNLRFFHAQPRPLAGDSAIRPIGDAADQEIRPVDPSPPPERVARFAEMPIVNTRCETVGKMRAVGKLTFV